MQLYNIQIYISLNIHISNYLGSPPPEGNLIWLPGDWDDELVIILVLVVSQIYLEISNTPEVLDITLKTKQVLCNSNETFSQKFFLPSIGAWISLVPSTLLRPRAQFSAWTGFSDWALSRQAHLNTTAEPSGPYTVTPTLYCQLFQLGFQPPFQSFGMLLSLSVSPW